MRAKYGKKSLMKLADRVDPRLVHFAMELERQPDLPCDLTISETSRTMEAQIENVKKGYSKTLNSKHVRQNNTSGLIEAVDIVGFVGGAPTWDDAILSKINGVAKRVIKDLEYNEIIECGCEWNSFVDRPHYQIASKGKLLNDIEKFKISPKAIDKIKSFEGLYLKSYKCPAGVWTIGYGTTKGVKEGQTITEKEAETLLMAELRECEKQVNNLVNVKLTQGQFDALVSFVYNLGSGNLKKSTLLKKLNIGDYAGAANEFPKWNKAKGEILAGLTKRRNEEKNMFLEVTHV